MVKPVLSPCYQCLQVSFGIDVHLIDNHFLTIRELQIDSLKYNGKLSIIIQNFHFPHSPSPV